MLKLKITSLILFSCCLLFGQQFHFKNYSLEEGLSRSGVYFILQDHAGFLWIGTDGGGVCKYDGRRFQNYTRQDGLASEKVRIIFEDSNQTLWFGTDNGLSFFEDNQFKTLNTDDGLSDNFIRAITQDTAGNLWVGTNRGISIIDPGEREISHKLKQNFNLPHKKIRSILADSSVVWIGTDAGLCYYKDSKIHSVKTTEGVASDIVLSLFMDSQHQLWTGTPQGLYKVTQDSITHWTTSDGLINNRVRSICEDTYHNIWVGTKKGVSIFNGKSFLNLSIENGLSNERIRCIQNDNFDNMWLGTYFGGIMRFNYKDFVAFTPKEGLISNQILSIIEDEKGDIVVGSFDGISKLKIQDSKLTDIKQVTTENGLLSNAVQAIFKDNNGYYWYGTDEGITIIKEDKILNITKQDGLKSENITAINYFDSTYYVGTSLGLAEIKVNADYTASEVKFTTIEDGLAGHAVSFIELDNHQQVWIGFLDGGLSILSNNQLVNPILKGQMDEITSIAFDQTGRVWLGTNGNGLFYGNYTQESKALSLDRLSAKTNLTSNYIYSLLVQNQNIWIGNEKGLDVIRINQDSSFSVQSFGLESGFLGLQNNRNSSYLDHLGNLWFGTVNGLYMMNQRELKFIEKGKKTINYIKSVKVNKETIDWAESDYAKGIEGNFNLPVDLELPYDINNISFDFIAMNYVFPEKIRYVWKLDGFENRWTNLEEKNYCTYTNLEPGAYTFMLKSTNERGELLDEITQFSFEVRKPVWMTWWFRILSIIIISGLVLMYMNYRTKQLLNRQKTLEETIDKRTEEITNQKREIEVQHEELTEKSKEITDSILYSRRIQHSLLPSQEKIEQLLADHFIFYKPKDIVSGDFYWIEQNPQNPNQTYFAVADCTGHGVPGAMVSLIGTRALNSSLLQNRLFHPNEILDKTNEIVMDAFFDSEAKIAINDGMDIALGKLDYSNEIAIEFEFSGAHNPAWIVLPIGSEDLEVNGIKIEPDLRNETHKLFVINANKQPIGHFIKQVKFTNHTSILKKGYRIYFFSDGYADQFGGYNISQNDSRGKKYKYKPLKKFLLNTQSLSISDQKEALEKEFYSWKQDFDQIDDVCFMGIEV